MVWVISTQWQCCLLKSENTIFRQDEELINKLHRLREMNVSFKKKNNTSNHRQNSSDARSLKLFEAANKQSAHRIDFIKRASLETDNSFSGEHISVSSEPTPQNNNQHGDQGIPDSVHKCKLRGNLSGTSNYS